MAARFFAQEDRSGSATLPSKRVALVVGNSAYPHARLPNARNDAHLIASALEAIGFSTELLTDVGKAALETAIVRLGERIENAGSGAFGFFYFAGHGVQHAGVNFILPVDADLPDVRYLRSGAVPVDLVIDEIERSRHSQATVVALDACRDNRIPDRSGSPLRGLTSMRRVPPGTIVAFATAADQIAEDGSGSNSPFAASLSKRLLEPGRRLDEVFFTVARDVAAATDGAQQPSLFVQGAVPPLLLAGDDMASVEQQPAEQEIAPGPPATPAPAPRQPRKVQASVPPRMLALLNRGARLKPKGIADRWRASLGPLWSGIAPRLPRIPARWVVAGAAGLALAVTAAVLLWPSHRPAFAIDDPTTWPVSRERAVLWPRPAPCPKPFSATPFGCFAGGGNVGVLTMVGMARPMNRPMALQILRRMGPCPAGADFESPVACLIELPLHSEAELRLARGTSPGSAPPADCAQGGKGVLLVTTATPKVEVCALGLPPGVDRAALARAWNDATGIVVKIGATPAVGRLRPKAWEAPCDGLANPHYCLTVTLPAVPEPPRRAPHVVVVNDGASRIDFLHVAPDTAAQWGDDRLGKGTLPRGLALRIPSATRRGACSRSAPSIPTSAKTPGPGSTFACSLKWCSPGPDSGPLSALWPPLSPPTARKPLQSAAMPPGGPGG